MATGIAPAPRLLLTSREAAEVLGISTKTLWDQTTPRGPIPVVKLSPGTVRYSLAALERCIESQTQTGK